MKVNFSEVFVDLDGDVITDNGKPVTLGKMAAQALLATDPNAPESGDEKARAYSVALTANRGGEAELDIEDVALIKQKIGKYMTAIIVGQAFRMLEQR